MQGTVRSLAAVVSAIVILCGDGDGRDPPVKGHASSNDSVDVVTSDFIVLTILHIIIDVGDMNHVLRAGRHLSLSISGNLCRRNLTAFAGNRHGEERGNGKELHNGFVVLQGSCKDRVVKWLNLFFMIACFTVLVSPLYSYVDWGSLAEQINLRWKNMHRLVIKCFGFGGEKIRIII